MSTPSPAPLPVEQELLAAVAQGRHYAPHDVLGAHPHPDGTAVTYRVLRPLAGTVEVVRAGDGVRVELEHEHDGVFVGVAPIPAAAGVSAGDYRVHVAYPVGEDGALGDVEEQDDPYRHLPTVGELDLHLIAEGRHERLWEALGARVRRSDDGAVVGTSFAVWAPNARAVRVVGDHNGWSGRVQAMRSLGASGVWELFVPGVGHGTRYKYEILGVDGHWRQKADPLARWTEVPPATASRVWDSEYTFRDREWMQRRAQTDPHEQPLSVYEVHLGSWRPGLGYRELAEQLVEYVTWLGFTHVEFLPPAEHPFGGSWGYQVTGFYAPTSRFGTPDEFKHLVDALHAAGIGVIVDWVPAHFPKDEFALGRFDGSCVYEHPDPRRGEHPDWGTYVFDYGRPQVRNFLVANALYWLEEFHIDGLRVDAVASMLYLDYSRNEGEWEPNVHGGNHNLEAIAFLREVNTTAYRSHPGIHMIAEESTAFEGVSAPVDAGGLGFGKKWNMGWMHDTLAYLGEDPVNRSWHHGQWTFSMVYAYSENYVLPLSHDEVVHGKGSLLTKIPGDRSVQLATLRAYFAYMWAHPGKKLLFMGGEYAQPSEWSEGDGLDWGASWAPEHRGVQLTMRELNRQYGKTPALWSADHTPDGFTWLEKDAAQENLLAFVRHAAAGHDDGRDLVCLTHLSGVERQGYRLGVPSAGQWEIVLDTSDAALAGRAEDAAAQDALLAQRSMSTVTAEDTPWHGQDHSVVVNVPALTTLWLRPRCGTM
ncbi:glycogen-branching enzyme [Micrococcus sp. HMSC067E09]|uniref:1,4-alpha-glucan branching protein GlgB n=1 Tax=Micrococcus TaxID=1269 RepID=UPI0008A4DC2D|nr:1,4-alpha-glucan branching protein GlgB [Micrococcus lylae]OFR87261.1 glycogen-branching enzyme [Micrococcus sp. HMSC067E09]